MRDTNLLRLAPPWTVTSSGLHARVPRARCDKCGVKKISVPWARDGGGLTLLLKPWSGPWFQRCPATPWPDWWASTTPGYGASLDQPHVRKDLKDHLASADVCHLSRSPRS